jgi:hypothetical protein
MTRFALLALLVGCATNDNTTPIPHQRPEQHLPTSQNPNFTLYVSNQSIDQWLVDMQITIDGQLAVSGDFNTYAKTESGEGCGGAPEGIPQHNWYEFKFDLAPGPHTILVTSQDVAATIVANDIAEKFGVVTYWYDLPNNQESEFDFFSQNDQPYFD